MKVTKVVIPAAGLGTRFLPATKALPKEMLPIIDIPTIQLIVEEAVKAGIRDILIVTGKSKRAIEDHFDRNFVLENALEQKHKTELLNEVRRITDLANIHFIRQKEAKGLGHAIMCAKTFTAGEPFGIMLGDDVVDSKVPAIKQLMDVYEEKECSVVGVQKVKQSDISKFGIVDIDQEERDGLFKVANLVEKPKVEDAPSDVAILGRYVVTPEIFDVLENTTPGAGNEIQLTDALKTLLNTQNMYAYNFKGKRYDVGDKLGFLSATVEMALKRDDIKNEFGKYLKEISKDL